MPHAGMQGDTKIRLPIRLTMPPKKPKQKSTVVVGTSKKHAMDRIYHHPR